MIVFRERAREGNRRNAVVRAKNQLLHFPKGEIGKGRIVCEGRDVEPCASLLGPFHLGIDQQDRIWVTNALGGHVTRFPAADPSKVEKFNTGWSGSDLGIDSQGNVWVTNRFGSSLRGEVLMGEMLLALKTGGNIDEVLTRAMSKQTGGRDGGSVTLLRPDGTAYPALRSMVAVSQAPGPWRSTATTTSGSRISPARRVQSSSFAVSAPRTARPA